MSVTCMHEPQKQLVFKSRTKAKTECGSMEVISCVWLSL